MLRKTRAWVPKNILPLAKLIACVAVLTCCSVPVIASQTHRPPEHTLLIVSDIHFNPMADPSLVAQLEAADVSQWESVLNHSKSTAFSQYGQDTNWWLLRSALDQMRKTAARPALVMVTGDSLAHKFPQTFASITHDNDRERYRKFVLKTMEFLRIQLRARYATTKIFITPGNDDDECGNYSVEAGGRFLHDTADLVRDLAQGNDELRASWEHSSWEHLGSFDVAHPALQKARIISLNTVFFSAKYQAAKFSEGCAAVPSNAPEQTLAWLKARLEEAKAAHEKVWLMFHIPPGIDPYSSIQAYQALLKSNPTEKGNPQLCASAVVPMWAPEWTRRFDDLLKQYPATVTAAFAGHTHTDDFRILGDQKDSRFVLVDPPISPVYNQNPAFRTVNFTGNGTLVDSSVYYLTNLLYASSTTPGEWQREYRFSAQWKLSRIDTAGLLELESRIRNEESVRDEWVKLYNVSSSAAYLPPGSTPGLYCATNELDEEAYRQCFCPTPSGAGTVPSH